MNIERLKELYEACPNKHKAAEEMGTTYQTMHNLIYRGSVCKVDLLEKIAAYFHVPVGYFFEGDNNPILQISKSALHEEIEKLKADLLQHNI